MMMVIIYRHNWLYDDNYHKIVGLLLFDDNYYKLLDYCRMMIIVINCYNMILSSSKRMKYQSIEDPLTILWCTLVAKRKPLSGKDDIFILSHFIQI